MIRIKRKFLTLMAMLSMCLGSALPGVAQQRYEGYGEPVKDLRIPFSAITDGGKLEVEMGSEPVDDYSAQ